MFRWGDYSGGTHGTTRILIRERPEYQSEKGKMSTGERSMMSFEDGGRESRAKECGTSLEAGKGREMGSP